MMPNTLNPAMVGSNDYLDIKTGYRQQWMGLDNAPETYIISIHGNINRHKPITHNKNALRISDPELLEKLAQEKGINMERMVSHGLGGYVSKDIQGAFSRDAANLAYALHLRIGRNSSLALGVSGTVINTQIDFNQIKVGNPDQDNLYNQYLQSNGREMVMKINSGLYYYSSDFMVGYGANNLYSNTLEGIGPDSSVNNLIEHSLLTGIKIPFSDNFSLVPGVLVRYAESYPLRMDLNLKACLADIGWIGGSYRNQNTVIGMVGIRLAQPLFLSYAYDYTLSGLGNYNTGSHEVILGLRLFNKNDGDTLLW